MVIEGRCLDEILRKLYEELSVSTDTFDASKGAGSDLLGAKVLLKDPRARISSTATRGRLISALAEFCWYMSGSADLAFIRYYIPTYPPLETTGKLREAYGPRLVGGGEFGRSCDQFSRVIDRLRRKPDTRRAVISLIEAGDLDSGSLEAPCTVALQFIRRRERLHMIAMMRSNDAYMGFIHDVFCFTMIQELVARSLGVDLGEYHHFATSLHLYKSDMDDAATYLGEGFQNPTFAMPRMPSGCQLQSLQDFLEVERGIREGSISSASQIGLPTYWKDLSLVLLRWADGKNRRGTEWTKANFAAISDGFYRNFFLKRPQVASVSETLVTEQRRLDLGDGDAGQS